MLQYDTGKSSCTSDVYIMSKRSAT